MLIAILRCCGHERASSSACSTTLIVSGPIRPVFSAASMKRFRLEEAAGRRTPARQRLEADQLARIQVDQRLEERNELAVLDAGANVFLELHAVGQLALQLRIEPGEAVPAGALGGVQREIALAEDVLVPLEAADLREADRRRHEHLDIAEVGRLRKLGKDRLRDLFGGLVRAAIQKNRELVAADPGAAAVLGRFGDERIGDTLEQLVADEVAVQVVDPLEMVEVEEKQDARAPGLQSGGERAHQLAAVREACRRVGIGIAFREPLRLLIGIERLAQILRATPAEQDDGDIEQERDRQSIVGFELHARDRGRQHLAAERDEQDDRRRRRAAGDQVAARNSHSLAPRRLHRSGLF